MTGTCVYDADCGFCTRSALWLERHGDCTIAPWQSLDLDLVGLTEEQVASELQWLDADGRPMASGAAAVAEALKSCGRGYRLLGQLISARPVRPLADVGYAFVARHRYQLPGGTAACRTDVSEG
ncbi:DCC1-like thiol-disulfide oxidoreductase family protein [Nocardioides sp.]|uniref:thiol-disulfide oxidoreductase DCC family protein n=1 Tax=Nocardioides sp. TaxID=35761 RepID=UPI0031FF2CA6|nr:hypothetical protein [Nocardioides sp.]